MSHVTYVHESYATLQNIKRVRSCVWESRVAHEWVMSLIWMSHVICMHESHATLQNIKKESVCVWESRVAHTGWRTCVRCFVFTCHFPQKNPLIDGSFVERELQLNASDASLPPCRWVMNIKTERIGVWESRVAHSIDESWKSNRRVCLCVRESCRT